METRKFSVCLVFCLLAVISQYSEARQPARARHARDADFDSDDNVLADGANDTDQNTDERPGRMSDDAEENAVIRTTPTTYNVTIGKSVRLECETNKRAIEVVVEWEMGDLKLVAANWRTSDTNDTNDSKYTFDNTTSALIVHSVALNDSGSYRCTVLQKPPVHVNHSLIVNESPRIVYISASDNRPREGADVVLTCNVTGSPKPEVIWSVEELTAENTTVNRKLTEKDGEFTRNSVFMKNVRRERSGMYYCYAVNWMGSATKAVSVVVLGKPRIHVHRPVINSAINVEAVLQCTVHEEPPVNITWYKNNVVITPGGTTSISTAASPLSSNLTVVPQSDDDFGTYTCQAERGADTHSRAVELVERPVLEELDVDGPKLAWRLHSHQPLLEVELQLRELAGSTWVRESVPLPSEQRPAYDMSHDVSAARLPAGKYEAVLKARNAKGWSTPQTAFVDIVEPEPQIQQASVYRGNGAAASRPAGAALAAALACLLVRPL